VAAETDQVWDYVIVGGGAAGCVMASRLTERSALKVLLVEAGEDFQPDAIPAPLQDILAATAHSNPRFTWKQQAKFVPRPGNAPDTRKPIRYAQGRVIGGGSSVNGMVSIRGVPSDYDGWAAAGATGWGWDDVLPFFRKMETDCDFDGPMHGKDGPMHVRRVFEDRWPGFTKGFVAAAEAEGYRNLKDKNANFGDGYFPIAVANRDGKRVSTATAYLTAEVRKRPNLAIIDQSRGERLLMDSTKVTGVRIQRLGQAMDLKAKEVIVSSGALHTPALLLRSGIGPGAELAERGIAVVADRAGVGRNLMEHPGVNFGCFMRPGARPSGGLRAPFYAGMRWSSGLKDVPAGDMYMIVMNKSFWHDVGSRVGLLSVWVNKSYSTGTVRLNPADPMAEPEVDFDMCSDWRDMERLVQGTKMMIRLQAQPAFQAAVNEVFPISYSDRARRYAVHTRQNAIETWIGARLMDAAAPLRRLMINTLMADGPSIRDLESDPETMSSWIRRSVLGHYHASCTCRMGAPDDPKAVTDPSGRVYGVTGLRIADASLFPAVPCANTNFPTIMLGEKMAATVLGEA